jgi:flagellar assembly protein FliH
MSSRKRTSSDARSEAASPFVYRPAPGWTLPEEDSSTAIAVLNEGTGAALAAAGGAGAEESAGAREKQAWEQGFREGIAKGQAEKELERQRQREPMAETLRQFAREREDYFRRVEAEVVHLALAIARKVLRREAQIDPLLLAGMVRVALEKMAGSSNVRLRVHPSQVEVWREFFAQQSGGVAAPELLGDAALEANQAHIETDLGVTELNLESQLKEIERGLLDLLAQRPASQ